MKDIKTIRKENPRFTRIEAGWYQLFLEEHSFLLPDNEMEAHWVFTREWLPDLHSDNCNEGDPTWGHAFCLWGKDWGSIWTCTESRGCSCCNCNEKEQTDDTD